MDFLGFLVVILVGVLLIVPFLVVQLFTNVKELKARVQSLEETLIAAEADKMMPKAKAAASEARVHPEEDEVAKDPPAFAPKSVAAAAAVAGVKTSERSTPVKPPELPKTAPLPVPDSTFAENPAPWLRPWLDKMGLLPPSSSDEGSNAMAWWSTRIGLALGVIAAVFLGMYVNQDTVPWVRLLELAAVAVGVFVGGLYLEKKVPPFGRALSAGGLGLLFVSAFAAYGLPAMKVIDSPMVGALVQALVLALIAAWSLWKGREAVFGLAMVLGYVTCWFSVAEGLDSVSLISLVLLTTIGSLLFATKGWWSGLWSAVAGSGLGLALQALITWSAGSGPQLGVLLAIALTLTLLPLVALSRQWLRGEKRIRRVVPVVTSIGVLSSAIAVGMRGFDFELFYLSFAGLFLLAGWWWRRDESEGIWQTLWAKAMVLIGLYIIAEFEGPVRAYSLLGQAGALLWLARTRSRIVFELGAFAAFLVGAILLAIELNSRPIATWMAEDWALMIFLFCGEILLLAYRKFVVEQSKSWRAWIASGCSVANVSAFLVVTLWGVENSFAALVAWIFGGLILALSFRELRQLKVCPPFLILLGTLAWLTVRENELSQSSWWLAAWVALAGAYYGWLARDKSQSLRLAANSLLWVTPLPIGIIAVNLLGSEWIPGVFLVVALVWTVLGGFFQMRALSHSSLWPAILAVAALVYFWSENEDAIVVTSLLLGSGWWYASWRGKMETEADRVLEYAWTSVFGVILWLALDHWLALETMPLGLVLTSSALLVGWKFLRSEALSWLSATYAALGVVRFLNVADLVGVVPWIAVIVSVVVAANGVWLSRPASGLGVMALPKVASVYWGGLCLIAIISGFSLAGTASWTTAAWATGSVGLLVCGFWVGLRAYRILALLGLLIAIVRLFLVDIDDSLWRILAFGVTGALLLGIGFLYNRYQKRLAIGDLDWGSPKSISSDGEQSLRDEVR